MAQSALREDAQNNFDRGARECQIADSHSGTAPRRMPGIYSGIRADEPS